MTKQSTVSTRIGRRTSMAVRSPRPATTLCEVETTPPAELKDDLSVPDDLAACLVRSAVYRRVPPDLRARLDRAILMPAESEDSIEQVARELKLTDQYGVSPAALRSYVRKVEQLMRPTVTSQIMAAVLSCLPEDYRRRLMDGSQVLLVSRLLATLTADNTGLTVAEMAKLASVLHMVSGTRAAVRGAARSAKPGDAPPETKASDPDPSRLSESVRRVYGLPWPAETERAGGSPQLPAVPCSPPVS